MVAGGNGVACPDDWFELIKNEFDYMYEEGKAGRPAMIVVMVISADKSLA
jgi:predicted fused transcriptional regulator/phosphomethylpyrimidine kinase